MRRQGLKQIVEEKTNGRFEVDLYPTSSWPPATSSAAWKWFTPAKSDVDLHSTIIHSNIEPKLAAISIPFAYKSLEEVDANDQQRSGHGRVAKLLRTRHRAPWIGENGFRQLTNSKHVVQNPKTSSA